MQHDDSASTGATTATTSLIPNTLVEDTPINRQVVAFCEGYRQALERRDAEALLAMASPRYHEDGGTPDPSDDYDFETLRRLLPERMRQAHFINFRFRIDSITVDRDHVLVDYTYFSTYQIETPDGPSDQQRTSANRLELEKIGETYRILSGM